jgi:N-terminal domain of anti-restriction factor ArdC
MRPISIEQAKQNRDEKIEKAKTLLADAVEGLQTSEGWREMLTKLASGGRFGLRRFSFGNRLLIEAQCPGATSAASYRAWLAAGRQVRKGEKALTILAPIFVKKPKVSGDEDETDSVLVGFRPMATFSGNQTDPSPGKAGKPLPEPVSVTQNIEADETFEHGVETLRAVAIGLGASVVADVELRPRQAGDDVAAHGWFDKRTKGIVVVIGETSRAQVFKTLAHEIAHAILHGNEDHHDRPKMEVEAESVAFVVSSVLGLETGGYSFPYVASWAGEKHAQTMVLQSGQKIVRATNIILDALFSTTDTEQDDMQEAA